MPDTPFPLSLYFFSLCGRHRLFLYYSIWLGCEDNVSGRKTFYYLLYFSYFMHHKDHVSDRKVPFAETEATVVFDWEKGRNSAQLFMMRHYLTACPGHRVPTPNPPSSLRGKKGINHLNEEITPLLPTGIGERFSQTISNLGRTALFCRCELPL
jgi:hypothetical protein